MPLPKPVPIGELRAAIAALKVITVWHQGEEIEVEPHALIQSQKTQALVLAARSPDGNDDAPWIFLRFAMIRGLQVSDRMFTPRLDVPEWVPLTRRRNEPIE